MPCIKVKVKSLSRLINDLRDELKKAQDALRDNPKNEFFQMDVEEKQLKLISVMDLQSMATWNMASDDLNVKLLLPAWVEIPEEMIIEAVINRTL